MNKSNDTEELRRCVAANALDFAQWLFPEGRRIGSAWYVGDLSGNPGDSLRIALAGKFAGSFRDWATGEHGDCIALVMEARRLNFARATRLLRDHFEVSESSSTPCSRKAGSEKKPPRLELPPVHPGTPGDFSTLSKGRNLSIDALRLASERGTLCFYDSIEGRAWLITDAARRNAQARRLDGQPWGCIGGKKAWTLRGSRAAWPIGLPESADFPAVALCEGGPDFLAAFHHAFASGVHDRIAPVCMIGAGLTIPDECLPSFHGKRIRIFVHDDAKGLNAARRWAAQLCCVASLVDGFEVSGLMRTDGEPVKDLCDLASIDTNSWETNHDTVAGCMAFAPTRRTL